MLPSSPRPNRAQSAHLPPATPPDASRYAARVEASVDDGALGTGRRPRPGHVDRVQLAAARGAGLWEARRHGIVTQLPARQPQLSAQAFGRRLGDFDPAATDALTCGTFASAIAAQHARGRPYVLATVKVDVPGRAGRGAGHRLMHYGAAAFARAKAHSPYDPLTRTPLQALCLDAAVGAFVPRVTYFLFAPGAPPRFLGEDDPFGEGAPLVALGIAAMDEADDGNGDGDAALLRFAGRAHEAGLVGAAAAAALAAAALAAPALPPGAFEATLVEAIRAGQGRALALALEVGRLARLDAVAVSTCLAEAIWSRSWPLTRLLLEAGAPAAAPLALADGAPGCTPEQYAERHGCGGLAHRLRGWGVPEAAPQPLPLSPIKRRPRRQPAGGSRRQ